jgi:uncharacterized protein (DUF2141 family)
MKKQTIVTGIISMLTITMMLTGLAGAQAEEGFTVSGQVTFKKAGNIHLELVTEEQFKADDDDDDDNAAGNHESVANLMFEIGEQERTQKKVSFKFTNIPAGTYVIQGFQDVNGNGDLDEGMFGPKEPWGMSMLKKKPRFRGPKLEEVKFEVTQDITDMIIKIK